jgi:TM2 domain-containing membrane protein YozV
MKNRSTAILLTLFLGGLGIHKFYLNKPGTGILYLCFCWTFIPAILALFEVFRLLAIDDISFNNKYNKYNKE